MSSLENEILQFSEKINKYRSAGKTIFASSSFQTHSIPMLKILSEIDRTIPVYFLNTGFHFPKTIEYRDQIADLYGLNLVSIESPISKSRQRDSSGNLLFTSDPDQCCHFNKTMPMDPITAKYDVWVSGVRKDQNENRQGFQLESQGANGVLRFHPMLNWTKQMIWAYIRENEIPRHPLEDAGYHSIGCEPCTRKMSFEDADSRDGRWQGLKKTECGLHTEMAGQ